jgi:hypothetical protein
MPNQLRTNSHHALVDALRAPEILQDEILGSAVAATGIVSTA